MASLRTFNRRTAILADRLRNNVATLKKQVGFDVVASIVDSTPVDRGVARSNTRARFGSPDQGTIPAYAPGMALGRGERANLTAALAVSRSRLRSAPQGVALRRTLFITNNVDYIGDLNNGNSRQQPAGFVERAAAIGRRRARQGITLRRRTNFR